jgi:hypothetical protein
MTAAWMRSDRHRQPKLAAPVGFARPVTSVGVTSMDRVRASLVATGINPVYYVSAVLPDCRVTINGGEKQCWLRL